jgi:hypothetical protein
MYLKKDIFINQLTRLKQTIDIKKYEILSKKKINFISQGKGGLKIIGTIKGLACYR